MEVPVGEMPFQNATKQRKFTWDSYFKFTFTIGYKLNIELLQGFHSSSTCVLFHIREKASQHKGSWDSSHSFRVASLMAFISQLLPRLSNGGLSGLIVIKSAPSLPVHWFVHIIAWEGLLIFSWEQASWGNAHVMIPFIPQIMTILLCLWHVLGAGLGTVDAGLRRMLSQLSGSFYQKYIESYGVSARRDLEVDTSRFALSFYRWEAPPRGKALPRVAYSYCISIHCLSVFQLKCCLDGSLYFLLLCFSHAAIVLDFSPSLPAW